MTKKRMFAAGAAVALTLGLGAGIAAAQTDDGDTSPSDPPAACTDGAMNGGDMDAMHAQMGDMPEDMQAQCDTMHAQGGGMTGSMMNGPMTGGGMMGAGMTPQS